MAEDQPPSLPGRADDASPDAPALPSRDLLVLMLFVVTLIGLCLMLYLFRHVWGDALSADTV